MQSGWETFWNIGFKVSPWGIVVGNVFGSFNWSNHCTCALCVYVCKCRLLSISDISWVFALFRLFVYVCVVCLLQYVQRVWSQNSLVLDLNLNVILFVVLHPYSLFSVLVCRRYTQAKHSQTNVVGCSFVSRCIKLSCERRRLRAASGDTKRHQTRH